MPSICGFLTEMREERVRRNVNSVRNYLRLSSQQNKGKYVRDMATCTKDRESSQPLLSTTVLDKTMLDLTRFNVHALWAGIATQIRSSFLYESFTGIHIIAKTF